MVSIIQEKGRKRIPIPENAGLAETSSLDGSALLGDIDEGNKKMQPSSNAVYSVGNEINLSNACDNKDEISKKNNEDTIPKSGETDVRIRPDCVEPGHDTEIISKKNNEDTIPNYGEAGAFESCDVRICSADSKSELQPDPDFVATGHGIEIISKKNNEDTIPKSGEAGAFESCGIQGWEDHRLGRYGEAAGLRRSSQGVRHPPPRLRRGQNSAPDQVQPDICICSADSKSELQPNPDFVEPGHVTEIISKKINEDTIPKSGEADSDEQGISKHSLAETKLKTGLEADHIAKRDETEVDHSIQPESAVGAVLDPPLGAFEAHNKGIGMKLMMKMGYSGTGGLGPRGQGIPVPLPLPKWRPERKGLGFKKRAEEVRRKDFQEPKMKNDK